MEKIYLMKEHLTDFAYRKITSSDLESVDSRELGEVVDMVKDLAQALESCAEARYYDAVADSMGAGKMGYTPQYTMGYQSNQYNTGQGGMSVTRGYSEEPLENVRSMMRTVDPSRKQQLKRDLENMLREL